MNDYEIPDLEGWAEYIEKLALDLGLSCYPQEFEISDQAQMLGYMAYSGLPSHYPHWSYGKAYERLKTMYDYGVTGLPYEMVINSNPCLAYLMRDNSLLMQVLTQRLLQEQFHLSPNPGGAGRRPLQGSCQKDPQLHRRPNDRNRAGGRRPRLGTCDIASVPP